MILELLMLFASRSLAMNCLSGKRIVVTGASGGIGAGVAKHLASQGARVIVHYHTRREGAMATKQAIDASPVGSCDGVLQCDFRRPEAIEDMWKSIDEVWGFNIDCLVNNAGIVTKCAAEDDENLAAWSECMQVNLNAPLQLSVAAYKRMKKQSTGGSIIMIGSIHGTVSVEWMTAYACSKAALDRLTAGLSCEWAPDGVRVLSVAPGIIPVERTQNVLSTGAAQELWLPHLPVGRMGTVEDIAKAVEFCISADWASGSTITLDGGMGARANMPFRPRPR